MVTADANTRDLNYDSIDTFIHFAVKPFGPPPLSQRMTRIGRAGKKVHNLLLGSLN